MDGILMAALIFGIAAVATNVVALLWMLRLRRTPDAEWQQRLDELAATSDVVAVRH